MGTRIVVVLALRRLLVALAIALAAPAALAAGALAQGSGEPAPQLALRDIEGRDVRLDAFRGRTVVVNFWATWCAPCVAEMPSLERLRARLARDGLEVLAVNMQENAARIRPFAERLALTMPMLRDHDGSARTAWGVSVFPTTYVVGPDQRIALVAVGEIDWDAPEVVDRVRAVMSRPGALPPSRQAGVSSRSAEAEPPPFLPRRLPWTVVAS